MPTIEYLPLANTATANVISQAVYQANVSPGGTLANGYVSGVALSAQVNKTLRQATVVSAAVATFVGNTLSANVADDGNVSALTSNIYSAVSSVATTIATPLADAARIAANTHADSAANAALAQANISANAAVNATIYSGNVSSLTTYPIGTYLLITHTNGVGVPNSNVTIYYGDPLSFSANYFTNNATGAVAGPLTGTWSIRGSAPSAGNVTLTQRIS